MLSPKLPALRLFMWASTGCSYAEEAVIQLSRQPLLVASSQRLTCCRPCKPCDGKDQSRPVQTTNACCDDTKFCLSMPVHYRTPLLWRVLPIGTFPENIDPDSPGVILPSLGPHPPIFQGTLAYLAEGQQLGMPLQHACHLPSCMGMTVSQ